MKPDKSIPWDPSWCVNWKPTETGGVIAHMMGVATMLVEPSTDPESGADFRCSYSTEDSTFQSPCNSIEQGKEFAVSTLKEKLQMVLYLLNGGWSLE